MYKTVAASGVSSLGFPAASTALETFGFKFSSGGAHSSRTMMLVELGAVLASVPRSSGVADYREAILERNVLGKTTDSARRESLRRLRELYALDEATPIFGLLRKLESMDAASLPLLAVQVVWARDPLFRATTSPVLDAPVGERVESARLAQAFESAFPNQYSEITRDPDRPACRVLVDPVRSPGRSCKQDPPSDHAYRRGRHDGSIPRGYLRLSRSSGLFQSLVPPAGYGPRPLEGYGLRGASGWTPQPARCG